MKVNCEGRRFEAAHKVLDRTKMLGLRGLAVKSRFGRKLDRAVKTKGYSFDFEGSSVFSFSRGNDGFLFLLEDGDGRAETLKRLREKLETIVDPDTKTKVVEKVLTRDEVYHGDKVDLLPDVIVKPAAGYSFTGQYLEGQKKLFVEVRRGRDFHMGMHHSDGIIVASGDGVKRGGQIAGSRLIDVAPTVLGFLGVAIPSEMDGVVLNDMFDAGLSCEYSGGRGEGDKTEEHSYTDSDVKDIEQRLRDLGYM